MAAWDQTAYKQDVVDAYGSTLQRLRPAYDLIARLFGAQPLTPPGQAIPLVFAACTCVAGDDPAVMRALLAACAHGAHLRGKAYLMLGLADTTRSWPSCGGGCMSPTGVTSTRPPRPPSGCPDWMGGSPTSRSPRSDAIVVRPAMGAQAEVYAMKERQLTSWEATSLMVGAGVGAGIMAVPFLAQRVGLLGLAIILPVAWAASALIHLMLAEVLFRTGRDLQIVELMRLYVLRGRIGQWLLWAVFALLSIAFLANLAAYVSGAGEIVADLTGIDRRLAELLVYVVSAGVVFFGLAGVGLAERFGALLLAGLVGVAGCRCDRGAV